MPVGPEVARHMPFSAICRKLSCGAVCRKLCRRLAADDRGNAVILFALALMPLLAGAGLAVDSLLAYSVQDKLQQSLDAAGLAAGAATDAATIQADADAYFRTNFNNGATLSSLRDYKLTTSADGNTLTVTATAVMPTRFMRLFGRPEVTVSGRTVVERQVKQMELALVLDNTGSMAGAAFTNMQQSAHELVDIVYGAADVHPNLWIAVVPFVSTVNVGQQHASWLRSSAQLSSIPYPSGVKWKGCVMARPNPFDETDDTPVTQGFDVFAYPDAVDNDWGAPRAPAANEALSAGNAGYGPNLGCGPAITPLIADKAAVHAALNGMGAWSRGGTAGNQGLVWGWRALSPRWRGMWGGSTPSTLPQDYDSRSTDKVVVILTDGNNDVYDWANQWFPNRYGKDDWCGYDRTKATTGETCPFGTSQASFRAPGGSDYTSYGRLWDFTWNGASTDAGKAILDTKMSRICQAMKSKGITIYTITFGATPNASTQTLYRNCATKPEYYFQSPTNAQLHTVFRAIGLQLSRLRVAR